MKYPHSRPTVGRSELRTMQSILASKNLAMGPQTEKLERYASKALKNRYTVAVSSGTAALHLALIGMGIGAGDEVLMPSFVCTALANASLLAGARLRLADVDPFTGNLTAATVERALTRRTRAIIVPHMFGQPANIQEIAKLGIPIIEDCAQCLGTTWRGVPVGTLSKVSVFSFYATKVLCGGEGGLVSTQTGKTAERIRDLRSYDNRSNFQIRYNYKISDLHAGLALVQWKQLAKFIAKRRLLAENYVRRLAPILEVPPKIVEAPTIYFRFIVRHSRAQTIIERLNKAGIGAARPVFKPLHRYFGTDGDFSGTNEAFLKMISLPIYPSMSVTAVAKICRKIEEIL